MIPTIEQLEGLLERVRAATGPDRELDRDIGFALDGWERSGDADDLIYVPFIAGYYPDHPGALYPSFTESVDAALALVERVLPGWRGVLDWTGEWTECELYPSPYAMSGGYANAAKTQPLAILAALLTALISQAKAGE